MNKEYKKINLREFRHNLTQLKDSLNAGQIYEVIDRGDVLAYFIPARYKVKLTEKQKLGSEDFESIFKAAIGCAELKDEIKGEKDYMEGYRKLLEKKYLKR